MTTKLHHYVPQFYLEGFGDSEKPSQIWVYERGVSTPRLQGIKNTAAETYYYSLESPDGTKVDLVEKELARIEANAAPVIQQLRSERRPTIRQSDREALTAFVATTYVRSPRMRTLIHEMTALLARFNLRELTENANEARDLLAAHPELEMTVEDLGTLARQVQDPAQFRLEVHRNALVGQALLLVNRAGPFIASRQWALWTAPVEVDFVTSDTPLSVFIQHPNGRATIGPGIGRPEAELTLPLSPRLALRLAYDQHLRSRRISAATAIEINRRVTAQSARFVFASRRSKRIASMVADFPPRSGAPAFDQEVMWARYKALRERHRGLVPPP